MRMRVWEGGGGRGGGGGGRGYGKGSSVGTEVTDSWQDTQGAGAVRGDAVLSIQNTKQKEVWAFIVKVGGLLVWTSL